MSIVLGVKKEGLEVLLDRDADFVSGMDYTENWPTGVEISLVFNDEPETKWVGTIDGPSLDWAVDKVQVNALIARLGERATPRVRLIYSEGGTEIVWAQGDVMIGRWRA